MLHGRAAAQRFLYMFGGCTELWSNMSAEAEVFAVRMTYGAKADYKTSGREPTDYVNSKLILMWGWSPGDGTFGTGTMPYLKWAKQQGMRIVCVDPRRTETSRQLADEHIFIRPGTDAAALIAMAYVIVSEGLHDQAYCDRHVLGFDEAHLPEGAPAGASYRSYLLGVARRRAEDAGMGRRDHRHPGRDDPAAGASSSPPPSRRRCRRAMRPAAPSSASSSIAPPMRWRRSPAMSASPAAIPAPATAPPAAPASRSWPTGKNPIEARVSSPLLADLLARGKAGGYPADIKLIYSVGGDLFNQCPNANKMVAALDGVEFIVGQDHFLTPTVRYADIVLPATTFWERNDVHTPWAGARHYAIFMRQAIAADVRVPQRHRHLHRPRRAARHRRLQRQDRDGVAARADRRRGRRFRRLCRAGRGALPGARGCGRLRRAKSAIPTTTNSPRPSGKIEIYSTALAANPDPYGLGRIPPIPTWIAPAPRPARLSAGAVHAEIAGAHPFDPRQPAEPGAGRSATTSGCIRDDAAARGIADGETVRVFNERGATILPARVTDRIAPGVVSIKEGAWFTPGPGRHRHARLRQRADRRPLGPVRRDDLQHQRGRDRGGRAAAVIRESLRGLSFATGRPAAAGVGTLPGGVRDICVVRPFFR